MLARAVAIHCLVEGAARLAKEPALQVRVRRPDEGDSRRAVNLLQQRVQSVGERPIDQIAVLDQVTGHEAVRRVGLEKDPELTCGLEKKDLGLLEGLVQPRPNAVEDPLELAKQETHLRLRCGAQSPDLGAVDVALIEALAKLHRLVEERANREIEEGLRTNPHHFPFGVRPEEGVAALLQAEEHALLAVADQGLHLLEAEIARPVSRRHVAEHPVDDQEIPHDVDQVRLDRAHERIIHVRSTGLQLAVHREREFGWLGREHRARRKRAAAESQTAPSRNRPGRDAGVEPHRNALGVLPVPGDPREAGQRWISRSP